MIRQTPSKQAEWSPPSKRWKRTSNSWRHVRGKSMPTYKITLQSSLTRSITYRRVRFSKWRRKCSACLEMNPSQLPERIKPSKVNK
ncbi:hypothetical protein COOONC_27157 [Cooperia oncophora]